MISTRNYEFNFALIVSRVLVALACDCERELAVSTCDNDYCVGITSLEGEGFPVYDYVD